MYKYLVYIGLQPLLRSKYVIGKVAFMYVVGRTAQLEHTSAGQVNRSTLTGTVIGNILS
ncbi:MAG TPA: hypothetical protein VLH18_05450 [Candidatus Limnocylindrales bacterium]|nr:hypothetical protein [Candidatus Limnocylindrales bacterium]